MSKLRISFTLVDNLDASTRENEGRLSSLFSCIGSIEVTTSKIGEMSPALVHQGGISCYLWKVIDTPPEHPYLEIEPTIVWVLDGWTSNDVYSNTAWYID